MDPYLDDTRNQPGVRLKFLARCDRLPLNHLLASRVGAHFLTTCNACVARTPETLLHFICSCPKYRAHRKKMYDRILACLSKHEQLDDPEKLDVAITAIAFSNMQDQDKLDVLLGRSTGSPSIDKSIDRAFKTFLSQSMRERELVEHAFWAEC